MKKYLKRVAAALLLLAVCTSLIPLKADAQITENDTLKLLTDRYQSGSDTFTLADRARMIVIADTAPTDELLQTAELINSEFAAAGLPTAQPLPLFWGSSNCALPGDVILELTQIGKKCHHGCEIFQKMGDCIMPREGVFAKVLHGGVIREGDELTIAYDI